MRVPSSQEGTVRTRCLQTDRLFFVRIQKSVLRGLGLSDMTCSCGTGRGGAEESWRAADVGKYMPVDAFGAGSDYCSSVQ